MGEKTLKVVHLNTWASGGAGNAALRISKALRDRGVDSRVLVLRSEKETDDLTSYERYINRKRGFNVFRILFFINKVLNQLPLGLDRKIFYNKPASIYRIHNHPWVKNADIIHLHWTAKFINHTTFFSKINVPIVWTLHDMHPFSGGKHYLSGFRKRYESLERKHSKIKMRAYKAASIFVVGPSKWLTNLSKNSPSLGSFPHFNIHNCADTTVFKPVVSNAQQDERKKSILFVAENVNDERKGFHILLEALKLLPQDIEIFVLGNVAKENLSGENIKPLGFVADPQKLSVIYSRADLFVIPSLEDNLPNTIVESHLCGTPAIGFNRCGVADMIIDGVNGLLIDNPNAEGLAEGIVKGLDLFHGKTQIRDKIRALAIENYSEGVVSKSYLSLYRKALE